MIRKLRVTVDGKAYEVTVETLDQPGTAPAAPAAQTPRPASSGQSASVAPPPASSPKPAAPPAAGAGGVPSPLAGKVVSIHVSAGASVKEGDQLITLEAMKMNTFVFAPSAGTVGKILVAPGDAVEEGQILVELS
jgi:biotin carboxyl carrier protein